MTETPSSARASALVRNELLHVGDDGVDAPLDETRERRALGRRAGGGHLLLHVRDPAVEDERERPALGTRLGGEVGDELAVGGEALALGALQAPLGREVRVGHHEVAPHGVVADGLQQEALAAAVLAHDETA